jgi:hypothetical protein
MQIFHLRRKAIDGVALGNPCLLVFVPTVLWILKVLKCPGFKDWVPSLKILAGRAFKRWGHQEFRDSHL